MAIKKKHFILLAILMTSVLIAPSVGAAAATQSLLIPGYKYPTSWTADPYWDGIVSAGSSAVPMVVINPSNGPGTTANPDYQTQISRNQTAGIQQIGYVHTSYQTRNQADVFADIDAWHQLYPEVSGIFLDEIATAEPTLCYLSQTYNYTKVNYPNELVVANPGVHITDAMAPYADIFVTAEMSGTDYLNNYQPATSTFELTASNAPRIMHIVHGVSQADMAAVVAAARDRNAGWLFITDDTMPNPYDVLPSYFTDLVTEIDALPATVLTPRGQAPAPVGCVDPNAYVAPAPGENPVVSPPVVAEPVGAGGELVGSAAPAGERLAETGSSVWALGLVGGSMTLLAAWLIRRL